MSGPTQHTSFSQFSEKPLFSPGAGFEAFTLPGGLPLENTRAKFDTVTDQQMAQGREQRRTSLYAVSPSTTAVNTPYRPPFHPSSAPTTPPFGTSPAPVIPPFTSSPNPYASGTPLPGQPVSPPRYSKPSFGSPHHGNPSQNIQHSGYGPPSHRAHSFSSPYYSAPPPYPYYAVPSIDNAPPGANLPPFPPPDTFTPGVHVPAARETVLHSYLLRKVVVGAGLDSAIRYPPPRCDPGTRQTLRRRIIRWVADAARWTNLLWLHGPVMVGKSAIAQTIAEHCRDKGWLGAAFFFSRDRDDVGRVIPTLVYQLAVNYPAYKELASNCFITDPTILEQTLRVQFRKLISEPLFQLKDRGTHTQPLLLLLDGLDECQSGVGVQQELVELVADFSLAANASKLPVVWVVTSRTEWVILSGFSKYDCWKEMLHISTAEDIQDVSAFLRNGFTKIRDKNRNSFSEGRVWPQEDQLSVMNTLASGFFAAASAFLHFVDSDRLANPAARLEAGLNLMRGSLQLAIPDTWLALCSHYNDISRKIPNEVRPVTTRILAFLALIIKNDVPAQLLANILFLDQATFYASLRELYSVLDIPEPNDASQSPIRIHHESFLEYTRQYIVESPGSMSGLGFRADLQSFYVRWCDLWGMKCAHKLSNEAFQSYIPWPGEQAPNDIFRSVSAYVWEMWSSWRPSQLYGHFYCFNFAAHHDTGLFSQKIWLDLQHPTPMVTSLLCQLSAWATRRKEIYKAYHVLRAEPIYPTDFRLLEEYAYLINYKLMKKADFGYVESDSKGWSYVCLSMEGESIGPRCFPRIREALLDPQPMYFLLGHDSFSCLLIMHRPTLALRAFMLAAFQQIRHTYPQTTSHDEPWPAPDDLDKIVSASETSEEVFTQARLPSLARTIVSFVGHPDYADPVGRLKRVLGILSQHCNQTTILELLRAQSLTDIPNDMLPAANRVFTFLLCHATKAPRRGIPAGKISAFLGLEQDVVEKVLRMTNLTLSSRPLPYPMSAVADFDLSDLLDHCTGERAFVPKRDRDGQGSSPHHWSAISPQTWLEICIQYVRWCDNLLLEEPTRPAHSDGESVSDGGSVMTREEEAEAMFKRDVLAGGHWIAFSQIAKDTAHGIVVALQESCFFRVVPLYCDFQIPHYDEMATHFGTFVNSLYSFQIELDLKHIIRVNSNCDMDNELLAKWEQLSTCRKATFPIDFTWVTCYFTTFQSNWAQDKFTSGTWDYFWLGCGRNTCLVTFQLEDEDEQVMSGSE